MSYFRRPNPKSNWKRPKPKIYDCNSRDLENFYQNSYGEYLSLKRDREARDLERDRRGDPEELTRRFEQRRASSLVYGEDDRPRTHRLIPNRQTSNDGSSAEHSFLRSRLESSLDSGGISESSRIGESRSSAGRHVSFGGNLNAPDGNEEMASIETRLERLRKLREDLGLPSDNNGGASMSSSSTVTETESRGRDSSRFGRSGSAMRSDSRSRASPAHETSSSSYSSRTERSSAMRNGADEGSSYLPPRRDEQTSSSYTSRRAGGDEGSSYTSRRAGGDEGSSFSSKSSYSSKSNLGGDTNGYKDSYESSSSSRKSRSRVEKPSLDGIDMNFDDDALLTDVKKKFPSSSEILERIRGMDI